ncbi:MAG: hypothetical protein KAI33_02100, partial [Elusimicrobiales bacterium]|nr:hypothetical protein [Elusimicrobiales bacterium]
YKLGPDNLEFSQSGVIKIRYSDAVLSSLGVDESTLGIYQFTADGSTIMKLPYNTVNTDANEITARVPKLTSLFAILVSSQQAENIPPSIYPDGISPVTTIGFIGITYPASDGTFISDKSSISFTATDPQVPNVETSDISIINYFVDPDTSIEISTYTGPFILNEGIHQIHYLSMDTPENYEFPKSATVYIDALEPETDLEITGSSFTEAGVVYININSSISLHAYDPPGLSNVMAGIKGTYFLIDITMDQCVGTPTFAGPHGTCDNPIYSEPFMLRVGTHTISFFSEDNVGNIENHKLVEVSVGDLPDITAPITELDFTHESYQSSEGQLYTNVISSIELTAYDPQIENQTNSGFATTYYLVDVDTTTVQPLMYSEPFSLTEGSHTVYYASVDNAENFEEGKTTIVYADGTAPITSLRVSEFESSGVGETVYMVETDSISITVIDPVVNGVASDVNAIYFLVDTTIDQCLSEPTLNGPAGTCENPVYSEPFILSAGTHTIYYMSADNVDNKEEAKTVNIVVESSFSFDFSGTAQSPTSISWVWNLKEDATAYQVISSSGGAISSILDGSATYYIQTNLIP